MRSPRAAQQQVYPWMNQVSLSQVPKGLPVSGSARLPTQGHLGVICSWSVPPASPPPRRAQETGACPSLQPGAALFAEGMSPVWLTQVLTLNLPGTRSQGWFIEPLNGDNSPFGWVEVPGCSPGEGSNTTVPFGQVGGDPTLPSLTTDVSFLSVFCKYLSLL